MQTGKTRIESHPFTVDNLLIEEIGQRLVQRDSVAISELIKNSYDADAKLVTITFSKMNSRDSSITVEDDGTGMNMDVIVKGWMRIGTVMKRTQRKSSIYNRPRTGSKGVGRFSCQRISRILKVETVSEENNSKTKISCTIDWTKFKPGKRLGFRKIKFHVEEDISQQTQTGTKLTMVGLRRKWTSSIVNDVADELSSIVKPVPWAEATVGRESETGDPGMSVSIVAEEFGYFGEIEPAFLKASWGTLEGSINEKGVTYSIRSRHISKVKKLKSNLNLPQLGSASFKIYLFVYKKSVLGDFSRKEATKISEKLSGVRIFYDGFRIPRYGDARDDWIGLDVTRAGRTDLRLAEEIKPFFTGTVKRPMLLRPGNNQLYGFVNLSRITNPDIHVSMSRDFIETNKAFEQLKLFVRRGIDLLTVAYASTVTPRRKSRKQVFKPVKKAVSSLKEIKAITREDASLPQESIDEINTKVDTAISDVQDVDTLLKKQLAMYHVLATTGLMTSIFTHDLREFLKALQRSIASVRLLLPAYDVDDKLTRQMDKVERWLEMVLFQSNLIGLMMGRSGRERRKKVLVLDIVDNIFLGFNQYMSDLNIKPENAATPGLRTPPMYPGEVYSIVINLTTNAIKAVQRAKKDRKLRIETSQHDRIFIIRFLDNGVGIRKADRERVFEPFDSTFEPDIDLGLGTGLGLPLIRDLLSDYDGTIEFINPPKGWKTCAEIKIPLGVDGQ